MDTPRPHADPHADQPAAGTLAVDVAFPPVSRLRRDGTLRATRRSWTPERLLFRIRNDPQLLLAAAIAVAVLALDGLAGLQRPLGLLGPATFLATQLWLTTIRTAPGWLPTARLALCLAFIGLANVWLGGTTSWPLTALALPVVALAAARGGRGERIVALAGLILMVTPLAAPATVLVDRQEVLAVAIASIVVAIGSRRVVLNLERSSDRLRSVNLRARRQTQQLATLEVVGRVLAREGPTPAALDRVMGVLEETFRYRYPSVYTWDGHVLHLGAQRNYDNPIQVFTTEQGIIGKTARTRQPAFVPDARSDPAFLVADPDVISEIAIPLLSDDELLGVLNVESSSEPPLDEHDFAVMQLIGDRLAAALALGRERQKLTERAALLDRLTSFATALGSSLDPATMDDEVAAGAAIVIPADSVVLVNRHDESGRFLITAIAGGDPTIVGRELKPGEGVSGRAITNRAVTVLDRLNRTEFPKAAAGVALPDSLGAMAAPMVIGDQVVGVVTWLRGDLSSPFSAQEQEVAGLLAGKVGLALANARLHQQTANAAITDPLTGLRNRRHFDTNLERDDALRRRVAAEKRPSRSAIMFDLDHFGQVNKQHGHQVGDRVLRLFADTLRARARASDLVARFGGEEFVVILESATRDDAMRVAEDVRTAFARLKVEIPGGPPVRTTVSAGCASLEAWEVEGSLLLERADVALAMAKHAGRNQVVAA
ncbi:MAG TPA: diguanylate cyclase [Candidatus Dormibacteraeota bacterium]|nr:diguanylate cyclase [Candidatus Dormibacteraeota bacterium]